MGQNASTNTPKLNQIRSLVNNSKKKERMRRALKPKYAAILLPKNRVLWAPNAPSPTQITLKMNKISFKRTISLRRQVSMKFQCVRPSAVPTNSLSKAEKSRLIVQDATESTVLIAKVERIQKKHVKNSKDNRLLKSKKRCN